VSRDNGTLVRVTDDGAGFSDQVPETHDSHRHFGLIEMRERAETAGGWWSVSSEKGVGTTVMFWLPTPQAVVA
jgi:signal transduction histidine kinase